MKSSGRIDQDNIDLSGLRRRQSIVCDSSGIGSVAMTNQADADTIGPYLQLVYRCGTEGICAATST